MKRNVVLTVMAFGASLMLGVAAEAQTADSSASPSSTPNCEWHHHHHGGDILEHLTNALGLSGTQQAQIAPILEAAKPQMKAVYDQAKTQRNAVIANTASQITPLLTGTQQAKFADMVQHMENSPLGGARLRERGHMSPANMLQKMTSTLGLSGSQQAEISPILDAAQAQIKTIRENTSLTPQQKWAQIKDTMQGAKGQIDGILTPAQQAQVAAMKAKWHHHGQGDDSQPSATPTATP